MQNERIVPSLGSGDPGTSSFTPLTDDTELWDGRRLLIFDM